MMEEINIEANLGEIRKVHERVVTLWKEKKRYLDSMKRSEEHIYEI